RHTRCLSDWSSDVCSSDLSTYHSLVLDFNRRFSGGLFFKTAYTWSKSMDGGSNTFSDNESNNTSGSPYAFLPALQRGPSDFDIRSEERRVGKECRTPSATC